MKNLLFKAGFIALLVAVTLINVKGYSSSTNNLAKINSSQQNALTDRIAGAKGEVGAASFVIYLGTYVATAKGLNKALAGLTKATRAFTQIITPTQHIAINEAIDMGKLD